MKYYLNYLIIMCSFLRSAAFSCTSQISANSTWYTVARTVGRALSSFTTLNVRTGRRSIKRLLWIRSIKQCRAGQTLCWHAGAYQRMRQTAISGSWTSIPWMQSQPNWTRSDLIWRTQLAMDLCLSLKMWLQIIAGESCAALYTPN